MKTNAEQHDKLDLAISEGTLTTGHVIPVIVSGGRKFKGKGYLLDVFEKCNDYGSSLVAKIWDTEKSAFAYASYRFCELDSNVGKDEIDHAEKDIKAKIIAETIAYCQAKLGPTAPFPEVQMYAQRCLAKRYQSQFINPWQAIQIDPEYIKAKQFSRVDKTVDWAMSLDHHRQAKIEEIIIRSLNNKGIDYRDFEEIITLKFSIRGWIPFKKMTFNKSQN